MFTSPENALVGGFLLFAFFGGSGDRCIYTTQRGDNVGVMVRGGRSAGSNWSVMASVLCRRTARSGM